MFTRRFISLLLSLLIVFSFVKPIKADTDEGAMGFVERLYEQIFSRQYDDEGREYWYGKLVTGEMSASNVARHFFSCEEYYNKNYSQDEFLKRMYKTFFNREPDPGGYEFWNNDLNNGCTRREVLDRFIESKEWADVCLQYGVVSGISESPTFVKTPSDGIKNFVETLFLNILGRPSDKDGFDFWTNDLANMKTSAKQCAIDFLHSSEFTEKYKNLNNEQRVEVFYKAFLLRPSDTGGREYYVNCLNNGATIDDLIVAFVDSKEFLNLATSMGIVTNFPTSTPIYNDSDPEKNSFKPNEGITSFNVDTVSGSVPINGYYDYAVAASIVNKINAYRVANGKSELSVTYDLTSACDIRAREICFIFEHTRPNGKQWNSVNSDIMYGENIAARGGNYSADVFFNQWKGSPDHNKNMLREDYKTIAVSVFVADSPNASGCQYFAVTNFGY